MAKSKSVTGKKDKKSKGVKKDVTKKDKKDKKKKVSESSSSSSSEMPADDPEEVKECVSVAATFGLKPKALHMTKHISKIGDLKVHQLAVLLTKVHECLTPQSIFSCGGELLESRRKVMSQLKLADGNEVLRARLALSKEVSEAEKLWRDRLLSLLGKVCEMDNMSVISQQSSLVSLRRSIKSEVETHMKGAEASRWLCELKQCLADGKSAAAKDMKPGQAECAEKKDKKDKKRRVETRSDSGSGESSSEDYRKGRFQKKKKKGSRKDDERDESPLAPTTASSSRATSDKIGEFFKNEINRLLPQENDKNLFERVCAAEGMDNVEKLLLNVEDGWRLNKHCCGQEGKELMGCVTWLGRRAGAKLVEGIADQLGEYKKKARLEEVPNGNEGRRRDSERLRVPSPGEHSRDSGRTLRLGEGDEAPSEEALFGDRELADVRPSAPVLEGDGGGTGLPRVALSESSSD